MVTSVRTIHSTCYIWCWFCDYKKAHKFYFNKFLPSVVPIILNFPGANACNSSCLLISEKDTPKDVSHKASVHTEFISASDSKVGSCNQISISPTPVSVSYTTRMTASAILISSTLTTIHWFPIYQHQLPQQLWVCQCPQQHSIHQ